MASLFNRREAVLLGTVALSAGQVWAQAKAGPAAKGERVVNTALLEALESCRRAGEDCLDHCVRSLSTGDKMMAECAGTVRQMLPLCEALAALVRQNSVHVKALAAICAKACRDCEASCKKHGNHHAECKACMESCQRCAAECEKAAA